MMIAGFSDKAGRRPAYIICFTIYMITSPTLALQDNYVALLVLRMLQSARSSGTGALVQGFVGDCALSAKQGKYVAYASVGSILGPSLSRLLLRRLLGDRTFLCRGFLLQLSLSLFGLHTHRSRRSGRDTYDEYSSRRLGFPVRKNKFTDHLIPA